MFHFKPVTILNLPEITKTIIEFLPDNILNSYGFNVFKPSHFEKISKLKELINSIKSWDLLKDIVVIVVPPDIWLENSPIHIDGDSPQHSSHVAFNIGLLNYEDSYTICYRLKNTPLLDEKIKFMNSDSSRPYNCYKEDEVEEVGRICYNSTTANLIDTSKPHKVTNYPNLVRVVISFRWNPPLRWNEIDKKILGIE